MPILDIIFSRPWLIASLKRARHSSSVEAREQAARVAVGDRGLGEVGVDRGGADADQHGEVVGVQALAGAHDERAEAAQALADEVAVHGAHGQDHRHRRPVGPDMLVGQDQGLGSRRARPPRPPGGCGRARRRSVAVGIRRRRCSRWSRRFSPKCSLTALDARSWSAPGSRAAGSGSGSGPRRRRCRDCRSGSSGSSPAIRASGSIGGLVTWLNCWRKKWCRPR